MDAVPADTEVLVVGGGPGGYVAAIRAAQLGRDVVLIEKDAVGGVCLNHGCIPSKALITTTGRVHEVGTMAHRGVYADPYVELAELIAWKDDVVRRLTGGVTRLLDANGVTVIDGRAEFFDAESMAVAGDANDEWARIAFDNAIVATGSRPSEITGFPFDADPILSSKQALALETLPRHLVVIGAGYIGLELATVFAKLGVAVEVIEALDAPLPGYEDDVAQVVQRRAEDLGIDFHLGESAAEWDGTTPGDVVVRTEREDGGDNEYTTDRVLVAVGRTPTPETVTPQAAGIELTDRGFVRTDEYGRTTADGIYAVGDVAGEPMLAHEASQAGIAVAETIARSPTAVDPTAVPAAVFTDPEVATVGHTAAAAEEAGYEVAIGRFPFAASGRAMTRDRELGFVRVVTDAEDGRILGAQVVGDHAAELISELALAVRAGLAAETVAETVHTHPTLAEAVKEACEHALGRAIHTWNR